MGTEANKHVSHWADQAAQRIVREKGKKDEYRCASGITPSGVIHIGNFREIITVDLVVRALRDAGHRAVFLYFWDDYDALRKVPATVQDAEVFSQHLRKPLSAIPAPDGVTESTGQRYSDVYEQQIEALLPLLGVMPQYIRQTEQYRSLRYVDEVQKALQRREKIREILDTFRTQPLPSDWMPVTVYSPKSGKDETTVTAVTQQGLRYRCEKSGEEQEVILSAENAANTKTSGKVGQTRQPAVPSKEADAGLSEPSSGVEQVAGLVKLLWRIDWPMRWAHYGIDFEPAGKDHHSEGGSFDTARQIIHAVYGSEAPVSLQYDFIRMKGGSGKLSSSSGEVVSLGDVLLVYQPEVVRYLFAGTRPNVEFAISFDADVIKIYEDYDRCERIYFGQEQVGEKRARKERRIYELSQIAHTTGELNTLPTSLPAQIPFRHLCNMLLIHGGNIEKALGAMPGCSSLSNEWQSRAQCRARCAWYWLQHCAPEEFRFSVVDTVSATDAADSFSLSAEQKALLEQFVITVTSVFDTLSEKDMQNLMYSIAREQEIKPAVLFQTLYQVLIRKDSGPRLGAFLKMLGRERVLSIINKVLAAGR